MVQAPKYWVHARLISHLDDWLSLEGLPSESPEGSKAGTGAPERLPVEIQYALWARAREHFEPGFALRAGASMAVTALPTVGPLMAVAGTVRGALQHLARRAGMLSNAADLRFQETPDGGALVQQLFHPEHPLVATESALSHWTTMIRLLSGRPVLPDQVCLPFPSPEPAYHAGFFQCPVHYGASGPEVHFSVASLDLPLLGHDPEVEAVLLAIANKREQLEPQALTRRCKTYFRSTQSDRNETLTTVASRLGMSARSLQRGLEAEGVGFRELRDEALAERAMRLLADAHWTIDQVADEVGYDRRSFHRAFTRWTGLPPGTWRRELLST